MIKAVLFDFDDTLVRTYKTAIRHFEHIAKTMGIKIPDERDMRRQWGKSWGEFVQKLWPKTDPDVFARMFGSVLKRLDGFQQVDGVSGTLRKLSDSYVLGIVSSRERISLPIMAEHANIDMGLFRHVVTWNDVEHYKPDPRVFDGIIGKLEGQGISRQEVVYIGDNLVDLNAARGAGLHFLAVTTGVTGREEFIKEGMEEHKILKSFMELPEKLKHF